MGLLSIIFFIVSIASADEISKPFIQIGHNNTINSVAVSTDGRYIVSGSVDSQLKLWDFQSSKELTTLQGHTDLIRSVVFSPNGNYILSGSFDDMVKLWDVASAQELKTFSGHTDDIWSVAFSPDGKYIISGSGDKTVKLWDVSSGLELQTFKGHAGDVRSVAFSPDGKYIISGSGDKTVKLWDVSSGLELQTFRQHKYGVNAVAFSPDGKYVLSGSSDKTLKLWDVKNANVLKTFKGHSDGIVSVAYSPDGKLVLSAGLDLDGKSVRLWDVVTGKELKTFSGDIASVEFVTFSPDGHYILVAGIGPMEMWSVKSAEAVKVLEGYSSPVRALVLSADKNYVFAGTNDSMIQMWDLRNGTQVKRFQDVRSPVYAMALSPDGYNLISGSNNTIKTWDTRSGKLIDTIVTAPDISLVPITSLAITPDGYYILTSHRFPNSFYYDGQHYSQTTDATLKLWEVYSGNAVQSFQGYTKSINALALSKDGMYALSGGDDHTIKMWNMESGKLLKTFAGHDSHVNAVTFSPDEKYLYSGSMDNRIKLWDIKSGEAVRTFNGHSSYVNNVIVNAKGTYVFSSSGDQTIKVWDINSAKELKTLAGHTSSVEALLLNHDESYLISGSWDGSIKVWDIDSGEELVSFIALKDGEWIAITPEGYFNGSKNALKYLNITRSGKDGVDPFDVSQLYDHFFRPDLVKIKLSGDEAAFQKATNGLTYQDALKNPPPKLAFKSIDSTETKTSGFEYEPVETKKEKVNLTFNVNEHNGGGIGLIRIYQEGKLIQTIGEGKVNKQSANVDAILEQEKLDSTLKENQKTYIASLSKSIQGNISIEDTIAKVQSKTTTNQSGTYDLELELKSGKNEISIEAFNKTNTVTSYRENITINANIPKQKPKLYAIVAGVNEFEAPSVNNLKYSQNDAQTIKEAAEKKMNTVFDDVEVIYLTGKEVTKDNILKAAQDISKKAKLDDTVLFYISTHGRAARGKLYLVPYNNKSVKNWIDFEQTFQAVQSIKALNQIFVIDACESGKANDIVSSVYDSRASVLAKSSGVHMLLATTKGTSAFEHPDPTIKNGVFTHRILQAMRDNTTDANKDSLISILELSKKLKEPSNNADYQYPVIRNVGKDVELERVK